MQDLLLLTAVAAVFILGWFLMKRLDIFLDETISADQSIENVGQTCYNEQQTEKGERQWKYRNAEH